MSSPTGAEWLDQPVRIARDAVYFGEYRLPGLISEDGIALRPGGAEDVNRLTVEFLVGPVTADDPSITEKITPQPNTYWYGVIEDGETP